DVFERKTVAALAAVATDTPVHIVDELPGGGTGPITLTPIVHAMLDHDAPWHRYAQAVLIGLPEATTRATLTDALRGLLDHHDVLRSTLRGSPGAWTWEIAEKGTIDPAVLVDVIPADHTPGARPPG